MPNSERKVFHVLPGDEGWIVRAVHSNRKVGTFGSKPDAVAAAREKAEKGGLGQVVIHKKDGQIEKEYTYGKDPKRHKG